MNKTPNSNRIHISIFGKRNVGKSSLLNAIIGQDIAVVSNVKGTTTDPVKKAMEFIPLGPVLFIDTAGLDDDGELGQKRVEKSMQTLHQTDFAIYVMDSNCIDKESLYIVKRRFKRFNIPYLLVINKIDSISNDEVKKIKEYYPDASFVSTYESGSILELKNELISRIKKYEEEERTMIGDIVP